MEQTDFPTHDIKLRVPLMDEEIKDIPERGREFISEGDNNNSRKKLYYGVRDRPPFYLSFLFGLQQILMALAGCLTMSFTLADVVCAGEADPIRGQIVSTTLFMVGLCTILQTLIGIRLPIIQGPSSSFLLPLLAMRNFDEWKCTPALDVEDNNSTIYALTIANETSVDGSSSTYHRLQQLQGSLMLAASFQLLIGVTGVIGFLLRFIGPITVAPMIALIGLSLFKVVLIYAPSQWGISIMCAVLILIFSLLLADKPVPLPSYNRKAGWRIHKLPLFKVFPILLSMIIFWLLCLVLTETNVFPAQPTFPAFRARTDIYNDIIRRAPWFYVPHPGQYGLPAFSAAAFLGMVAATICSVIESIGDYYACARVCNTPPPPKHAVNRGVAMEGLGSIISGLLGAGHSTTSYSGNIGAIAVTKVASRSVFVTTGLITIVLSVIGKAGAVLVSIPAPVLGGVQLIVFSMLTSIGLSTLQYADLKSSRNLLIVGVSLLVGLTIPEWISKNSAAIDTGNAELDQVIAVFLGTPMFLGGVLAFILDNAAPGTIEERGIRQWREAMTDPASGHSTEDELDISVFDPPLFDRFLSKFAFVKYMPFLPNPPDSQPCETDVASVELAEYKQVESTEHI